MKESINIFCCANAVKKKTLEENYMQNSNETNFKFMSLGTPQKNGAIEQGFATHYSQMRVMMVHAELHENLKTGIWPECASTVTKLEIIMVKPHKEKCNQTTQNT